MGLDFSGRTASTSSRSSMSRTHFSHSVSLLGCDIENPFSTNHMFSTQERLLVQWKHQEEKNKLSLDHSEKMEKIIILLIYILSLITPFIPLITLSSLSQSISYFSLGPTHTHMHACTRACTHSHTHMHMHIHTKESACTHTYLNLHSCIV